jgi:hypothetical protein
MNQELVIGESEALDIRAGLQQGMDLGVYG